MHIAVWGCGYLGTTHAAAMAELGAASVIGVDTDATKIKMLQCGDVPFHEPHLQPLIERHLRSNVLQFTNNADDAGRADVHFVCVGTPQQTGSTRCDLSQVDAAIAAICKVLKPGAVVVGKSTVPVGTAARVEPQVTAAGGHLVWNPEFLREGTAVHDSLYPDRIVVGSSVASRDAAVLVAGLYRSTTDVDGPPVVLCDLATAELVKISANTFLAMKISFVNLLAELCDATEGDVVTLADALGLDSRIGRRFLNAGVGFGGGCLGKDLRAFGARGAELGVGDAADLVDVLDRVNDRARQRGADKVVAALELSGRDVQDAVVVVLGAAFKPGSDDVRDSSSLAIARLLTGRGATVRVVDPVTSSSDEVMISSDVDTALTGADAVLLATEWGDYVALDPTSVAALMRTRIAVDGRNVWDRRRWEANGFLFDAMGRR